jgi:hypothetical protein
MRTRTIALVTAALALTAGSANAVGVAEHNAEARVQTIAAKPGRWEAFSGKGFNGTSLCGISAEPIADRAVARSVAIKFVSGADYLTIDIYKQSWDIPKATHLEIELQFDGTGAVTFPAYGDGNIVDVRIPTKSISDFLLSLSGHQSLRIGFPRGREGDWYVGLDGAKRAVKKLVECTQAFSKKSSPPTQPFGN